MKNVLNSCVSAQLFILMIFTSIFFIPFQGFSQNTLTQTVKGTVIDQQSEQPIFGANIVLLNSDPFLGAASELDGTFRLENVPIGRHNFQITCIGYENASVLEIEVGAGKEVVLNGYGNSVEVFDPHSEKFSLAPNGPVLSNRAYSAAVVPIPPKNFI